MARVPRSRSATPKGCVVTFASVADSGIDLKYKCGTGRTGTRRVHEANTLVSTASTRVNQGYSKMGSGSERDWEPDAEVHFIGGAHCTIDRIDDPTISAGQVFELFCAAPKMGPLSGVRRRRRSR